MHRGFVIYLQIENRGFVICLNTGHVLFKLDTRHANLTYQNFDKRILVLYRKVTY